jgi:LacI family transcriptional regulator
VARVPFDAPDVEARIDALLAEKPTAIFAANNLLAEQAWRVLRRRGLKLPHDISLVGFDDVQWMGMVEPGITVVDQPTVELGRRAAALLLRRMEDPLCPPAVERLDATLVVRASTAPPRA